LARALYPRCGDRGDLPEKQKKTLHWYTHCHNCNHTPAGRQATGPGWGLEAHCGRGKKPVFKYVVKLVVIISDWRPYY
jgi:hypothetical protein